MNALDKKLIATDRIRQENWIKLISVLKRQSQEWATERFRREGYADFKIVFMPVFMNIPPDGINNNELATHARVTKQAMSKVAKELQKLGYIKSKTDPRDKRSTIIMFTERGKKLMLEARRCVQDLTKEYQDLVGHAEFNHAIEIMKTIIHYNDSILLLRK